MTEQEREIKRVISYIRSCRNAGIDTTITIDKYRNHFILNALEEIYQYQAIGTVEECREARERQRMKKIKNRKLLRDFCNRPYSVRGDCPNCGNIGLLSINTDYCNACGQKLDWSDTP